MKVKWIDNSVLFKKKGNVNATMLFPSRTIFAYKNFNHLDFNWGNMGYIKKRFYQTQRSNEIFEQFHGMVTKFFSFKTKKLLSRG